MIYDYKPSFDRSFKRLSAEQQVRTKQAHDLLADFFAGGQKTAGLGLKKLHDPFWEARVGLGIRILFAFEGQVVSFLLVGDHNEIRRYLKHAT